MTWKPANQVEASISACTFRPAVDGYLEAGEQERWGRARARGGAQRASATFGRMAGGSRLAAPAPSRPALSCPLQRGCVPALLPAWPQLEPGDAGEEERHPDRPHWSGVTEGEYRRADRHQCECLARSTVPKRRNDGERDREPEQAGAEVEDVAEGFGFEKVVDKPTAAGLTEAVACSPFRRRSPTRSRGRRRAPCTG